jgi:hypothetical protein
VVDDRQQERHREKPAVMVSADGHAEDLASNERRRP